MARGRQERMERKVGESGGLEGERGPGRGW